MKILLLAYYYPPFNNGGVQRPLKIKKYLEAFGIETIIATVGFDNGELKIYEDLVRVNAKRFTLFNLRYLHSRLVARLMNPSSIKTYPYDFWRYKLEILSDKIAGHFNPNAVMATYPPLESLEAGMFFAKKFNLPLISDFRDGLIFEPVDPKINLGKINKYMHIKESSVVSASALITTASEPITDYFQSKYNYKNLITVMNGYDSSDYENLPVIKIDKSKFNITFTGRMSMSCKTTESSIFFKAMEELAEEDVTIRSRVRLNMLGEFDESEHHNMTRLKEMGILQSYGMLPRKDALAFQKSSDLLLLITGEKRRSVVTGKLFEYIYSGKPILALSEGTEAARFIRKLNCGWVVKANDMDHIKNTLRNILCAGKNSTDIRNNKPDIKEYSSENQMKKLFEAIKKIK